MAELDYNGIIKANAEGDKATSLSIGVYQGNGSLVVFSNKQMAAKFSFPRAIFTKLRLVMTSLITAAPETKVNFAFSKYDMESKKSNNLGNLVVGKDAKSIIYFGIQAPGHPAMKFPLKSPLSFDLADPMSDQDKSILAAQTIIDQLTTDIPYALMATSFKRENTGGGNRGGYSGGNRSNTGGGDDIF